MQANDALVQPMLGVALFQGLARDQIATIARGAERIVYRPGETILTADTIGDAAVLIVSGDAVRIIGPEISSANEIEVVAEGSLLGEMAMLVEVTHASTIIARGQVRALRITRAELLVQLERDASLADHLMRKIASRLTDLAGVMRAVDLAFSADFAEAAQQPQLH